MNRHSTPPQTTPPYTNGHYETPLDISGVSLHRPPSTQQPTVFPANLSLSGVSPLLYALHRFRLGGAPASRYLAGLWLLIAAFALLGVLPGRWFSVALALVVWAAQIIIGYRYQHRHYVTFLPRTLPALDEKPLDTTEKISIYATGLFNVEGRYQPYSVLPGFYRTFATGEHAILCRVPERKWLGFLNWPADETGMWYAFVSPADIQRLSWGNLQFGSHALPAIAVEYRLELPPSPRRKKPEIRQETLYLASSQQDDAQRIYVDLANNLPSGNVATSLPSTTPPSA